jgi:acetyl esterase/lipase
MKYVILTLFAMSVSVSINAQGDTPLYANKIPNYKEAPNLVSSATTDGIMRVSNVSIPTYTLFLASNANNTPTPFVVICPGGGYRILASSHEGTDIAKKFNEIGVSAMVLYYRMPNDLNQVNKEFAPLQDAQQAIRLVRQHAQKWKIDPAKVGIMGFSAGGHLASSAATHFDKDYIGLNDGVNLRPDFQILLYPVVTFRDHAHAGSRQSLIGTNPSEDLLHLFSNEEQVNSKTPPAFIVHAADDKAVPVKNSLAYIEKLNSFGVAVDYIQYAKGGHGFGLNNKTTPDRWFEDLTIWFSANQLR